LQDLLGLLFSIDVGS